MAVSNFAERVRATILAALVAALVGGPAQAYQTLRDINQAESRDPSGRITTEASVIHVSCATGRTRMEGNTTSISTPGGPRSGPSCRRTGAAP
jgi:hypothetical protein